MKHILYLFFAAGLFLNASPVGAAEVNAVIRAAKGKCELSTDQGKTWQKADVAAKLGSGHLLRTGKEALIDVFLGDNGPVVRLKELTELRLAVLEKEQSGVEKVITTRLELRAGEILGNVKKLAAASSYTVKFPGGQMTVRGTEYGVNADGTVTVVAGVVTVTYDEHAGVQVGSGQKVKLPKSAKAKPRVIKVSEQSMHQLGLHVVCDCVQFAPPPPPPKTLGQRHFF